MIKEKFSLKMINIILFSSLFFGLTIQAEEKHHEKQPNILFIFADDLGWGDLSLHGSKTIETPNLDKLASEGSEFYQFSVANPVCSPSRAAVITGQSSARNNIHHHFASTEHHQKFAMPDWLDTSVVTIPKVLKNAGYKTAHFGKWHLTNSHIPDAPTLDQYGYDESAVFNGPGKQTDAVAVYNDTIKFINENKDNPFFINLWIHEPHTPHYPDPKFLKKYAHLEEQEQIYAAVVSGADAQIGRVLKALEDNGIDDNTLVIFSSDNGPEKAGDVNHRYLYGDPDAKVAGREPLGRYFSVGSAAGLRGGKRDTYEGGVRVPLIARWPENIPVGVVNTSSVVSAVDFLPTFAEIAGAKLPENYISDGESIVPLLKGKFVTRKKPVFWEWYFNGIETDADYDKSMLVVRKDEWKLFLDRTHNKVELYNLKYDRNEVNNIAQKYPDKVNQLKKLVLDWKQTLPRAPVENAFSSLRHNPSER